MAKKKKSSNHSFQPDVIVDLGTHKVILCKHCGFTKEDGSHKR